MASRHTDDLRPFAAGLARWYDEEMDPDTQEAFRKCGLGEDVRRLGFALIAGDDKDDARADASASAFATVE